MLPGKEEIMGESEAGENEKFPQSSCRAWPLALYNEAQPSGWHCAIGQEEENNVRRREGRKAEDQGEQISVGWLVGGKEKRKQKKGRGYSGFQERERENSGEGN